jgi:hypothetical protein
MKHCEQSIQSLFESEKTEARDRLASLSVAGGRPPTVSGLNGWVYEQTIRSCIECELQGDHPNLKIEEQVQFLKRSKLDLVIGLVAIEVKSAGLFGQADADKYRRYRKAVESSGKHFLYITSYETHIPYRELTVDIFGEDRAFFLDSSGTWERFIKTVLGLLTEAEQAHGEQRLTRPEFE